MPSEVVLDLIHRAMRRITGLKLISDLHERPTFPNIYPPLDRRLRDRLQRIHVAQTPSVYDLDHIFRPQFWYVADMAGRIAVDRICMIEDLERTVADYALTPFEKVAWINRSKRRDVKVRPDQLERLRQLYPIDFSIHEALRTGKLSSATGQRSRSPDQTSISPAASTRL